MDRNKKKIALIVVWIVILGALIATITNMDKIVPKKDDNPPATVLNTAEVSKEWPSIIAHSTGGARGAANAPYTMVEFGDFECPMCGKMCPVVENFLKKNSKYVNLYFVHRIWSFHPYAIPAAQATEYAAEKGKFWQMYHLLYTNQDNLEPGFYGTYGKKIGLDGDDLIKKIESNSYKKKVVDTSAFAESIGIKSTPVVIIRDNKTGKVVYAPSHDEINNLFANPPWASSGGVNNAPNSPKGN